MPPFGRPCGSPSSSRRSRASLPSTLGRTLSVAGQCSATDHCALQPPLLLRNPLLDVVDLGCIRRFEFGDARGERLVLALELALLLLDVPPGGRRRGAVLHLLGSARRSDKNAVGADIDGLTIGAGVGQEKFPDLVRMAHA